MSVTLCPLVLVTLHVPSCQVELIQVLFHRVFMCDKGRSLLGTDANLDGCPHEKQRVWSRCEWAKQHWFKIPCGTRGRINPGTKRTLPLKLPSSTCHTWHMALYTSRYTHSKQKRDRLSFLPTQFSFQPRLFVLQSIQKANVRNIAVQTFLICISLFKTLFKQWKCNSEQWELTEEILSAILTAKHWVMALAPFQLHQWEGKADVWCLRPATTQAAFTGNPEIWGKLIVSVIS